MAKNSTGRSLAPALVIALDADAAGQQQWRQCAREAALRGKRVRVLPSEAYGGFKDASEAWAAGRLAVGAGPALAAASGEEDAVPEALREAWEEGAAIRAINGHLTHAEAERLAWTGLQPAREEY